ncbi:MAG: S9 family peptidase [Bacteroidetes bacterium]|nr:MAG: S9 family peptidase [Bacteroidota bacterium]
MKKNSLLIIGIVIITFFSSCNQAKKEMKATKVPLKDFFRNPEKSSFQISPDGKYYSFKAPYKKRMNIFVQEIGKDSIIQLTKDTTRSISGYFWANNNRILYLRDTGGDENYKLYGVNIDGSNLICLTDFDGVRTQIIDDLEDIPDEVIIGLNKRNPQIFDPYRLNIVTGEMKMIAENPGNIMGWMTDHAGKLRVAFVLNGLETSILYRDTEDQDFKVVLTTDYKEGVDPLFFDFDNKNVYASSNLGRDKKEIVLFDIANGKEIKTIYKNDEVDVSRLSYSKKRKVVTSVSYVTDKRHRHFFDKETEDLFTRLKKDLGQYEIAITSETKNEDKFIVRTYSDRSLGAYYLYDTNTDKLEKIIDAAPWIDENNMAIEKPIEYKSRDGLTIHGYLTLPKGVEAKNLPVVINPHGGPWARDYWGFNPEVQYLANKGYAVLQMNFRGSTGYGRKFLESSYKQWGLTMQDDISDGVKWLIDQGIADPKRVAIYGASYGGYATLAGLTFTPELYACGVDYVGVANLFTFMKSIPPYWKPMLEMMYNQVGDPVKDSALLAAASPVLHADKIVVPLFIAQGANDPRVNKNESDQMVAAMKARGIEVEYMVKDNEGHGFHNEENRMDFYRAMGDFLDQHIGDRPKVETDTEVKEEVEK